MFTAQTLARRLLYTMLPRYLLLTLGAIGVQLAIQYVVVGRAIGSDLAALGRTVEPGMAQAVWELDAARLTSMASGMRHNTIVSGVRITSAGGDLEVLNGARGQPSGGAWPGLTRAVALPLFHALPNGQLRRIGELQLYSGAEVLWARIRYSCLLALFNSLAVSGGLWLIFSWTIRFRLSHSVTRVARAVADWRAAGETAPARPIDYPYQDELGALVQALNEGHLQLVETLGRLREANQNLEATVASRTDQLRQAKDAAEAASQAKGQFLANMSHEIRTPMNATLGMLYLALKAELAPAVRNHLLKAQRAALSLLGIIDDILDLSKIEAGKLAIEAVPFELEAVLEQLSDAVGHQAGQKGLEFLIRYDPAIPATLVGDPLRLGQVLLNLCGNAVKFTAHGEVELAFRALESAAGRLRIEVSVRDCGIGMSAEVQRTLFEKFTQADQSTTRRFGGTGLGLAISRQLVELMGGRIWIEHSAPGAGTTICFTLDLGVPASARRGVSLGAVGPLLRGVRVLVVDDKPAARAILAEMLGVLQTGIGQAGGGPAALAELAAAAAAGRPYDLVLMDWRMPGMNGDEVTQRLRDSGLTPQPQVVMVSAYGREDAMRLAQQAGVNGFLIKPVSPSTLLDTIVTVLGRERVLAPAAPAAPAAQPGLLAGARLLLVEDNDINREFACELLTGEGIAVDQAQDGRQALEMVEHGDYDGVLMDIQMPLMDGLEAARRIRALAGRPGGERFASLPIIAMTALAMAQDGANSRAAGMNDHISKPIAPEQLMAALARWVRPARPAPLPAAAASRAALPPELLALASLDAREGLRRIGGKVDAYRRQLRRFRAHHGGAHAQLAALLGQGALESAAQFCHALSGVCGNLGADALYRHLAACDALLRQGRAPDAAALAELGTLLAALLADIDSLAPPAPAPPAAAPDGAALLARLEQLARALEYDLGAVDAVLAELRSDIAGGASAAALEAIAAKADVFAIDEALSLIDALRRQLQSGQQAGTTG